MSQEAVLSCTNIRNLRSPYKRDDSGHARGNTLVTNTTDSYEYERISSGYENLNMRRDSRLSGKISKHVVLSFRPFIGDITQIPQYSEKPYRCAHTYLELSVPSSGLWPDVGFECAIDVPYRKHARFIERFGSWSCHNTSYNRRLVDRCFVVLSAGTLHHNHIARLCL